MSDNIVFYVFGTLRDVEQLLWKTDTDLQTNHPWH